MKIAILVASLLSLGASALPEAEESITVGEYTYTGGDLPKGELKVTYSSCVIWKGDAAARLGLARSGGKFANPAIAIASAAMAAIHATADDICASQDLVPPYASDEYSTKSGGKLTAATNLRAVTIRGRRDAEDSCACCSASHDVWWHGRDILDIQ
ncbi:hypothetical protein E4U56_007944 [Claviceps arundinis]|uniref:Uncharacterized protein n=1 Tax=Claviceps arundinis TaxID=1623583 RepID=A0A9P7MU51_9HYPO|nr:hypothetical protein E4U56_007944 [Claviceps arundinis]